MIGRQRKDDETQATSRRSVIVVGRGLATVMGGGVAILVGVTVILVFNFFLSEFAGFSVSGGHDAGRAYGRASAATGLAGSLLGLFAMDLLLALLFFWRYMRTQHELPRGGLFSKASCSVAMTGSMGMTVVFALKASVALWPYADSLASLISRELGSDVIGLGFIGAVGGFLGGLVGVLVGVGVGAVVGAVVHTEVRNLGPQEARVLTVAGLLLSSISVFMFLAIIYLFVFDM